MPNLTWGDTVRVKTGAPPEARPDALAAVVGIRVIETAAQGRAVGATIGTTMYVIEFSDGSSIEVPASWIEPLDSPP